MITHSLLNPAAAALPISRTSKPICSGHHESQSFPGVRSSLQASQDKAPHTKTNFVQRRSLVFGVVGAVVGASLGEKSAMAGKRAPPPPPVEKKDPNISGLAANKKRKEAMQQEVARLRSKGKPVQ